MTRRPKFHGGLIPEAQELLRRQGGPIAARAIELLDDIAADLARDAEAVAHIDLPPEAGEREILAELAAAAVTEPPPTSPSLTNSASASFTAFLAAQRARVSRHPGVRGHVWGGAPGNNRRGGQS